MNDRIAGAAELIIRFPGQIPAAVSVAGGKGAALTRLAAAGFPVPPGAVLTTDFFVPWFKAVRELEDWSRLTASSPQEWTAHCDALKQGAAALPVTERQRDALAELLDGRDTAAGTRLLAVRSSSPEEDLSTASFAGLYETRLGVDPNGLEAAVRACFVSSLDARVLRYKAEHGMDPFAPQIAVIVQEQIDSEVAGVGFSINPLNNDYDEALINANRGLGTSVVDGRVAPDEFIVDKHRRKIYEATTGAKQVTVSLATDGGTVEHKTEHPDQPCLDQSAVLELADLIVRVEDFFAEPVDIEWARAGGALFLLQARPVTAWIPLPPELATRSDEPRRLYADAALSKGLTTNAPISPFGLDQLREQFAAICEPFVGRLEPDPEPGQALFIFAGARMYINYSNILWLASPKRLAASAAPTDTLMAEILGNVDRQRYRAPHRPPWLGLRILGLIPRMLWSARGFAWRLLHMVLAPERAHRAYRDRACAFEAALRDRIDDELSLTDFRRRYSPQVARELINTIGPAMAAGMISPAFLLSKRDQAGRALVEQLFLGASGNVVVDMGIALHRLARRLGPAEFGDLERLAARIEQRDMPPEFLEEWDRFIAACGWRGPLEMDPARPRYGDDPRLALRQMAAMARGQGFDPEAAHRRRIAERQQAFETLHGRLGPLRRVILRRIYRLIEHFAGTRDTAKHLGVLFNYGVRRRALAEGRRLVRAGRLDRPEEIFELRFEDLDAARRDRLLDMRALAAERTCFQRKLIARVRHFPPVIDSRGRILGPPARAQTPGLLVGTPISPGVVTGPVRVLHTPDDQQIEPGDILVAYTTDPGWTPLFFSAAAIVLEVGGTLQHGALVAREFGKPCVVGIDGVTGRLEDGELVEVDGSTGTIRLL